jgi:hypothetical protein
MNFFFKATFPEPFGLNALARTLAPPITTSTSTPDLATSLTFHAAHSGARSSLCRHAAPQAPNSPPHSWRICPVLFLPPSPRASYRQSLHISLFIAPHRIAAHRLTLAQMTPSPRSRAFFCRRLASAPPTPPECPSLSNALAPPLVSSSPRVGPRALTLTQATGSGTSAFQPYCQRLPNAHRSPTASPRHL